MGLSLLAFLEPLTKSLGDNSARRFLYSGLTLQTRMENGSTPCQRSCTCENQSDSCVCPCLDEYGYSSFLAALASLSYLLLLIATIQLVLCMVYDAMNDDKPDPRYRKAFKVTIQKCLLGAVIWATGTRAIYFTVETFIPDEWADIILNLYYPALLFAFSLLICFWAEVFYHSLPTDGHNFIRKHKYSVVLTVFNVLVYLLLIADVVATPLVKDEQEQVRKSDIISSIFAFLLFVMLIGFLHLAIRLFFRPDWHPLFDRLEVLRINLKQQAFSCAGIISNALMQCLIICLLVFKMVSRFQDIDNHSLYVGAVIIRVTELCVPVWFCCSLWNYKHPKMLWILNPTLLLQQLENREESADDSETVPILGSHSSVSSGYGTISISTDEQTASSCRNGEEETRDDGYCWICLDEGDPQDLFYPCRCLLHRQCLKKWITTRASNANISEREFMKCQHCGEKYHTKRFLLDCVCLPRGLERKHWIRGLAVLLILFVSTLLAIYIMYSPLKKNQKVGVLCFIGVVNAVILKFAGFGLMWLYRRNKVTVADIVGRPVELQRCRMTHDDESSCDLRTGSSSSAVATVTPTVQQPTVEVHQC